ncbi:MAG: hypothetical protein VX667_02995 [Nitrospinota bacterium]|nr:hypothetical protein [Nitrospinota bacterium]
MIHSGNTQERTLFVDIRVGDPSFNSSTPGSHRFSVEQFIPLDNDMDSLKRDIWYETDLRYKLSTVPSDLLNSVLGVNK